MKTIEVKPEDVLLRELLACAREEDLVVRDADGTEYMLLAIDDFQKEIIETRKDKALMALLEERAKQKTTIPFKEFRKQQSI